MYKQELQDAMTMLGQDTRTIFLGQAVAYPGTGMYDTLENVSMDKRIEMPVAEDMQMGMSIGLSLQGYIPISIYPRFDFLMCAMNQLVNHLDKCEEMSSGEFIPHVIVRTAVGAKSPLYPGVQHCSDYTEGLSVILKNMRVTKLEDGDNALQVYENALNQRGGHLIVELADYY